MERQDQIQIAKDITDTLQADILRKIIHVPENWDGAEIRQWILDYYKSQFIFSTIIADKRCKRRKDYENELIVNNKIM